MMPATWHRNQKRHQWHDTNKMKYIACNIYAVLMLPLSSWKFAEWFFPSIAKRHFELKPVQNTQTFRRHQFCLWSRQQCGEDGTKVLHPQSKQQLCTLTSLIIVANYMHLLQVSLLRLCLKKLVVSVKSPALRFSDSFKNWPNLEKCKLVKHILKAVKYLVTLNNASD